MVRRPRLVVTTSRAKAAKPRAIPSPPHLERPEPSSIDQEPIILLGSRPRMHSSQTYQREISLHRAEESLPILLRSHDGRLAFASTTEECGFFHPALQLLIPSVRSDVVYGKRTISIRLRPGEWNGTDRQCRRLTRSLRCQHQQPKNSP